MEAPLYNMAGEELGTEELDRRVFGVEPNVAVMHQALVRQMANARRGQHSVQTRSEVRRTKKKWYRQKGTGRARHGSRAAPIFVGGGVAHGPAPRSYRKAMPKRMRRLALRSALSAKAAEDSIVLIDDLSMEVPRTADVLRLVDQLCEGETTLVLLAAENDPVERSIRNLPHVRYLRASYLNIRDLLGHERLLMDREALAQVVVHLGGEGRSGHERDDAVEAPVSGSGEAEDASD